MSYESKMLHELAMPTRPQVERLLLQTLFKHGGVIKEFGAEQRIVTELADAFELNQQQRSAFLETVYRKQNRVKKAYLWHRLLFRAADALAHSKMVSRPTETFRLTKKREWMLTEKGFDAALRLCKIPQANKEILPVKSFEVESVVKELTDSSKPDVYDPIDRNKRTVKTTKASTVRFRGFRQAVMEAYDFHCAVCGLKIPSPDLLSWEVEAAHIVPNRSLGRDDLWNGIALCRLHHWAFDVGWFALLDDYQIQVSSRICDLPAKFAKAGGYECIRSLANQAAKIHLPKRKEISPHCNALRWHRENIFAR
jgi:hypothetical protein